MVGTWLPWEGLQKIWLSARREFPAEKDRLNELDNVISSRPRKLIKNKLVVQVTSEEIHWLQNLYEREF